MTVDTFDRVSEREPGSRRVTPPRSTQLDDAPWQKFGIDAAAIGKSRSKVMAELILWWIRWPGAKLPRRPES